MRTDLARNYVFGPKLAFCLGWHRAVFTLPGNLALDFKQMHPEGLMPERVWYDLCSAFSHNPENFRAKRHIFSLFSICCELYGSQSYFSVNLNFPGPPSTGSSEVLPLRVCYIIRNSLAAALTAAFRVHLDQISAGRNCCTGCHLMAGWAPPTFVLIRRFTVLSSFILHRACGTETHCVIPCGV